MIITVAGLCILTVLTCKLYRWLTQSNDLLLETSQIMPMDGAERVSTKVDGDEHIKTNRDLHSPAEEDVLEDEPQASQEDFIKNVFALEAGNKVARRRKVNRLVTPQ